MFMAELEGKESISNTRVPLVIIWMEEYGFTIQTVAIIAGNLCAHPPVSVSILIPATN